MNPHYGPTSPEVTDNKSTPNFNFDSHYSKYTKRTRRSLTRKLTQHFKRAVRNQNCPKLKPLSDQQIQHIRNTITNAKNVEICHHLCQEHDNGCIEYKWKLLCPQPDRLQHLITQMNYRLGEGNNICFYQIGVKDNGFPQGLSLKELIDSVTTVYLMAKQISNIFVSIEKIFKGKDGNIAKLKVIRNNINIDCKSSHISSDIRLLVAGNASVGKSTLIGVLTRGKLDDGCGSARKHVIQHRHEIRDGRTSSISYHILGFDSNGCITNYKAFRKSEWQEIIYASTKLITFVDQPGHYRYMKTSVSGLASQPHYVMLTVSLDEFDRKDDEINGKCNGKKVKSTNELWSQMLSLNLDNLLGNEDTDDTTTTTDIETSEDDYGQDEDDDYGQCLSNVQIDGDFGQENFNQENENFGQEKENFNQVKENFVWQKISETKKNTNADTNERKNENHCKYKNIRHRKENNLIRKELKLTSNLLPNTSIQAIKSIDPSPAYHKYIKICNSINIPLFIVITKSDTDQHHNYQRLPKMIEKIRVMINKKFANYLKIKIIRTSSDVFTAAHAFTRIKSVTHIPIFICSCFNGEGLDLLKMFLFALETPAAMKNSIQEKNHEINEDNKHLMTEFGIYNIFNIPNVGIILGGIVRNGEIHVNDDMLLGPDSKGKYSLVTVQSIHVRKQPCLTAFEQQMASIQLSPNISQVRRGMVLVSIVTVPDIHTGYAFEAKIDILPACSIEEHSQPIVYVDSTRQSAHILQLKPNGKLMENTTGIGIFSFVHRPEYIRNNRRIIIRSSSGPIAIGIILRLLDTSDEPLIPVSLTKAKKKKFESKKKSIKNYLSKWNLKNLKKGGGEGGGSDDVFSTENEMSVGSNESLKDDRGSILAIMELEKIFSKSIEN